MAHEFFQRPTPANTGALLTLGAAMLAYAVTSDVPPRFSFLTGFALTGASIFFGAYQVLSRLEQHLPAFLRPTRTAPAA